MATMLDLRLRPLKEHLLDPVTTPLAVIVGPWLFSAMAGLVVVNVIQRLIWANRHLGP